MYLYIDWIDWKYKTFVVVRCQCVLFCCSFIFFQNTFSFVEFQLYIRIWNFVLYISMSPKKFFNTNWPVKPAMSIRLRFFASNITTVSFLADGAYLSDTHKSPRRLSWKVKTYNLDIYNQWIFLSNLCVSLNRVYFDTWIMNSR